MSGDEILLLGHGSVENLDDVPAFLTNIRRGRPSPPELISEIRHRNQAIGGSPLLRISRELAAQLEARLGQKVHFAARFWHPFARDVLAELARREVCALKVISLAPFSGHVYGAEMQRLAEEQRQKGAMPPRLSCAPNWGREPALVELFAAALRSTLGELPEERRAQAHVFFTAHSLPLAIVKNGDPYPDEVQATADAVRAAAGLENANANANVNRCRLVFQSQGASDGAWLGPDIRQSLAAAKDQGARDVVFCPIGFLGDHVEILYDLDIEARKWAEDSGLTYRRTASPNTSPQLVDALALVAGRL